MLDQVKLVLQIVTALALFVFTRDASAISSVVNISTRMRVETGDNVLIGGFIVSGTGSKDIMLRALGPSLPVTGALSDPVLELHDASGATIAQNDSWRSAQQTQISATGLAPVDDREAALIATVPPGNYTAVVRGANDDSGVALVEVYDLDDPTSQSRLANISTRGDVQTGDDVMIGGFIIRGDLSKRMIARVRGPSLTLAGTPINGRMQDPAVELHDGSGALVAQNDNWRSTQETEIQASTLAPTDDREAAIVSTLQPGNYTTVVRGANNSTGIALVEFYDLDQPPSKDGSTLYISQMRAQAGSTSLGSGTATLRLAADQTSATISFSYSNLSGPITGMHVHASDGTILFDLDATTPQPDGTYIWIFQPVGTFSVADIIAMIQSGKTYLNLHTALYPKGEIKGFFNLSSGAQVAPVPTPPPPLATGTPSITDAARFLSQATFGPTDESIAHVQQVGFDAWLNEQFVAPASGHLAYVDAAGVNPPTIAQTMDAWWTFADTAQDQLRQRVAFALSEFFVVSVNSAGLGNNPVAMSAYYDVLVRDAFTNYRQLIEDITLNPAMGKYLDMLHNDKAGATHQPNENYGREIMQLFSIGLYDLNLDGSLTLDSSGFPIPTYTQDAVLGMAATFTGWNYAQTGTPVWNGATPDFRDPMMSVPSHHESAAKTILDGVVIPANQMPQQDLKMALDTIFNHPNVGPFFCRQLIQRLVTSNPSPGYVYRVASVFNDNGEGVRGDMQAVIRAILMDYDARGAVKTLQGSGHVREPVLRVTNLLRAFHANSADGKFQLGSPTQLGEVPMHSPTVFNFFSPDYEAPGAIAQNGLDSPELEITTETTTISTANYLRNAIYGGLGPAADRVTLDLSKDISLASTDAGQLVDHLNSVLMASSMSSDMRNIIVDAVNNIPASNPTERARTAIYLVINSPEFAVDK